MLCVFWALSVGLTCCFLMQRLTDNGAAQKLPSSGLNPETAQGDALLTLSLSQLCPVCITRTHTNEVCKSDTGFGFHLLSVLQNCDLVTHWSSAF